MGVSHLSPNEDEVVLLVEDEDEVLVEVFEVLVKVVVEVLEVEVLEDEGSVLELLASLDG